MDDKCVICNEDVGTMIYLTFESVKTGDMKIVVVCSFCYHFGTSPVLTHDYKLINRYTKYAD